MEGWGFVLVEALFWFDGLYIFDIIIHVVICICLFLNYSAMSYKQ